MSVDCRDTQKQTVQSWDLDLAETVITVGSKDTRRDNAQNKDQEEKDRDQ